MTVMYMFESPYWHTYLDYILAISATVFLAIAYQIIRHKHLQSHPAPLIAALALSEAFFGYMGVSRMLICSDNGHAEGLLAMTLFFNNSEES